MSLLNLLLSIFISMLLMQGALQWYQITKKSQLKIQKQITDLNSARTILQFMHLDFENAGYLGYRTLDENFPLYRIAAEENPIFLPKDRRVVYGFKTLPGICQLQGFSQQICDRAKDNSDFLVIYNIGKNIARLKQKMMNAEANIRTEEKSGIRTGSLVLIADLYQGDLFIANDVRNEWLFHQTTQGRNSTEKLSKAYGQDAELVESQTVFYYLGIPSRRVNLPSLHRQYVLYREDLRHGPEEIVDNVENFEVEYGFSTRERGVQYKKANQIDPLDWNFVVSIRLKIVLTNLNQPSPELHYEFSIPNRRHIYLSHFFYLNRIFNQPILFATDPLCS